MLLRDKKMLGGFKGEIEPLDKTNDNWIWIWRL
jgi:hypothetical protein